MLSQQNHIYFISEFVADMMTVLYAEVVHHTDIKDTWESIPEPPSLASVFKVPGDKERTLEQYISRFNKEP